MFAARQGLEPRLTGPEPVVLPLDDLAIALLVLGDIETTHEQFGHSSSEWGFFQSAKPRGTAPQRLQRFAPADVSSRYRRVSLCFTDNEALPYLTNSRATSS